MNLFVNMLIEWDSDQSPQVERLLWIDPSGVDVATIKINDPDALPIFQKAQDIEAALIAKDAQVLEIDPYASFQQSEDTIPEKHRQRRDIAWNVIAPLVEDSAGQIFYASGRGPKLNSHAKVQRRRFISICDDIGKVGKLGMLYFPCLIDVVLEASNGKVKERKEVGLAGFQW